MHRIDTPSRQKDKFGAGKDGFTQGDPQTGTQATQVSASFLDAVQEELIGVLSMASMQPDKSDFGQVAKAIQLIAFSSYPVGAPIPWPTTVPPSGFIAMMGQSFNALTYPKLAQAYPSLVLPDMRSEFIRGWDGTRGIDSGRTILSKQSGSSLRSCAGPKSASASNPANVWENSEFDEIQSVPVYGYVTANVSDPTSKSGIVRPRNIAFNYIVRAA